MFDVVVPIHGYQTIFQGTQFWSHRGGSCRFENGKYIFIDEQYDLGLVGIKYPSFKIINSGVKVDSEWFPGIFHVLTTGDKCCIICQEDWMLKY